MKRGKLVAVVGPSGSGKGTLMKRARSRYADIVFPVSCTTRGMRPGEQEGVDYYFLTREEFERRIDAGAFIEHASFGGNYYGTEKAEIEPALAEGKLVLREFEVQGVRILRDLLPHEEFVTIYIDAGPWEDMARRVQERAPITEEELEKRRVRYLDEATFLPEATYVVQNFDEKLEAAEHAFLEVIQGLRKELDLPA